MKILAIGDIHGNYKGLLELVKKAGGEDAFDMIITTGDMVDRGNDSLKVLKWFMKGGKRKALLGNHEMMILAHYSFNPTYAKLSKTLLSNMKLSATPDNGCSVTIDQLDELTKEKREEILKWMTGLETNLLNNIETPHEDKIIGIHFSHAPYISEALFKEMGYERGYSDEFVDSEYNLEKLWNINIPQRDSYTFSIHGHTGYGKRYGHTTGNNYYVKPVFNDTKPYFWDENAIIYSQCIDTMHHNKLTAMVVDTDNFDYNNIKLISVDFDISEVWSKFITIMDNAKIIN